MPISTAQGAGGISIQKDYRVDRTVLTVPEMQAILTGLGSLDSVSGTRRYTRLMEKLSAGTGGLAPGRAHVLIDLSSWYKTSLPPKMELIQRAIEQHLTSNLPISRLKRNLCGTSNPIPGIPLVRLVCVGLVPNTKGFPSL